MVGLTITIQSAPNAIMMSVNEHATSERNINILGEGRIRFGKLGWDFFIIQSIVGGGGGLVTHVACTGISIKQQCNTMYVIYSL